MVINRRWRNSRRCRSIERLLPLKWRLKNEEDKVFEYESNTQRVHLNRQNNALRGNEDNIKTLTAKLPYLLCQ